MSATRRILIAETFRPITKLAERGCSRAAGEAAADNDNFKFSAIIWTNEPRVVLVTIPLSGERPGRDLWVKRSNHNCCAGLTSPSKTAMGIEV